MNDKPPFDPPYFKTMHTDDGIQFTKVLDGGFFCAATEEESRRLEGIHKPSADLEATNPLASPKKSAAVVSRPVPTAPEHTRSMILLNVPFTQKENAKRAGARWDAIKRSGTHPAEPTWNY